MKTRAAEITRITMDVNRANLSQTAQVIQQRPPPAAPDFLFGLAAIGVISAVKL
jgi:hypothetical protein